MTNPFEAFNISDDEDNFVQSGTADNKVKRTHQEKRIYKQQQETTKTVTKASPVITEALPEKVKENAKVIRHNNRPTDKKLGDGHYLDRRSGTGREYIWSYSRDRPRKEGGGRGNVGNVKDDLNQDKYIKENAEEHQNETPVVEGEHPAGELKPEEPKTFTLEEYYKNKGVELSNVYEQKVTKKADINAEWIKKEKLTVLESKEDKKNSERNAQGLIKFSSAKVGLDENL